MAWCRALINCVTLCACTGRDPSEARAIKSEAVLTTLSMVEAESTGIAWTMVRGEMKCLGEGEPLDLFIANRSGKSWALASHSRQTERIPVVSTLEGYHL